MLLAELLVKLTGDDAKLKTAFSSAGSAVGKFEGIAKKSGISVSAIFKTMAVATLAAITFSIASYAKQEAAVNRLIGTLQNMKGATAETSVEFEKASVALMKKSKFGDEDILDSMTDMVQLTGDYNATLKNSSVIVDFAAGKQIDLKTSAMLVGKAYNGNTEMLRRYGIVLKDGIKGQEALDAINQKFHGAAERQINTLAGRTKYLGNIFGEYAEIIGSTVGPSLYNFIQERLIPMFDWFGKLIDRLGIFKKELHSIRVSELTVQIEQQQNEVNKLEKAYTKQSKTMGAASDSSRKMYDDLNNGRENLIKLKVELNKTIDSEQAFKDKNGEVVTTLQDTSKEVNAYAANIMAMSNIAGTALASAVTVVLDSTATMNEKMTGLLKAGLNAVLDVIGMQISAYIALETAKAISTGGLTAATIVGAAAQLAVIQGLKAAVGTISLEGMAKGGVKMQRGIVDFAEEGPEAALPLKTIEPLIGAAIEKYTTNKNNLKIIIQAQTIDNRTNFDNLARKIDRSLIKLNKRRGAA